MAQKQHVDLFRKVLLRKQLLRFAKEGAVYVPFFGDGDIATQVYHDRTIYGADLDPDRIKTAQSRLPLAYLKTADCNSWPFPEAIDTFAVADFDAYSNPYLSLESFWANSKKASTLVLLGTDGMRQRIKRSKCTKSLRPGEETPASPKEFRMQYNMWWTKFVVPYLTDLVRPWKITRKISYLRRDMLYWGAVLSNEKAAS